MSFIYSIVREKEDSSPSTQRSMFDFGAAWGEIVGSKAQKVDTIVAVDTVVKLRLDAGSNADESQVQMLHNCMKIVPSFATVVASVCIWRTADSVCRTQGDTGRMEKKTPVRHSCYIQSHALGEIRCASGPGRGGRLCRRLRGCG